MQEDTDTYELTAERREPARPRGRARIWFAVGALVVAAGAIWYAFDQTNKAGEQGVAPLIKADEAPTRVKPDEPGGMEVPHQDKAVYEKLGSDAPPTAPKAESLLPPPAPEAKAPQPTKAINIINAVKQSPPKPPETATAAKETAAPKETAPPPPAEMKTAAVTPSAGTEKTEMAAKPAAASGNYRVQLSSLRSEADADAAWKKLQAKFPELLGGLTSTVVKADLGDKGVYYRLQAGAMSEQAAKDLCAELKKRSADCLVVKS